MRVWLTFNNINNFINNSNEQIYCSAFKTSTIINSKIYDIVDWELNDFSITFFFLSRTQTFILKFAFLLDAASDRTSVTAQLKIGILGV